MLAAAVVSASFVSLVDLGTVRQASAQVEANSKSVVITLPPSDELPGWLYSYTPSSIDHLQTQTLYSTALPRGQVTLQKDERLLWVAPKSGFTLPSADTFSKNRIRGVALFDAEIGVELSKQLARVPGLEYLCLNQCTFSTDAALSQLSQAQQLTRLDLAFAKSVSAKGLAGVLDSNVLSALNLRGVLLSAEHMTALYTAARLKHLQLDSPDQAKIDLSLLARGKQLTFLSLTALHISSLSKAGEFASLQQLLLHECSGVTDDWLRSLCSLPELRRLSVASIDAAGQEFVKGVAESKQLQCIEVRSCTNLNGGHLLSALCRRSIDEVLLEYLNLTDISLSDVEQLSKWSVRKVSFAHCTINHVVWDLVGKVTNMRTFDVSGLKLSESMVSTIVTLPNLEELGLSGSHVGERDLLRLAGMASLRTLRFGLFGLTVDMKRRILEVNPNLDIR
ncbi:MAG: hypothetical protein IPK87_00040 [Planctomycetes bacterium]|nr:hypothetical protein [Planctomycetota bacterium]